MTRIEANKFASLVECPHCHKIHSVSISIDSYKRRPAYDWESVDWTLRNKEIAARMGCGQSMVSTRRRKHAPETVVPNSPRKP